MEMHNSFDRNNSVNGIISSVVDPSLGKDVHVRQVAPDRHPATVRSRSTIKIGTCNVRILHQFGKLENVIQEMKM